MKIKMCQVDRFLSIYVGSQVYTKMVKKDLQVSNIFLSFVHWPVQSNKLYYFKLTVL